MCFSSPHRTDSKCQCSLKFTHKNTKRFKTSYQIIKFNRKLQVYSVKLILHVLLPSGGSSGMFGLTAQQQQQQSIMQHLLAERRKRHEDYHKKISRESSAVNKYPDFFLLSSHFSSADEKVASGADSINDFCCHPP